VAATGAAATRRGAQRQGADTSVDTENDVKRRRAIPAIDDLHDVLTGLPQLTAVRLVRGNRVE
jgi:hypothetical protein